MKPGFGVQTMEKHAERMLADPLWTLRWIWYKRTGTPPVEFSEFTPAEITPFLVGMEEALDRKDGLSPTRWGPPRTLDAPSSWDEAVVTGDPLIDHWEQEIAAGRTPDLSAGLG